MKNMLLNFTILLACINFAFAEEKNKRPTKSTNELYRLNFEIRTRIFNPEKKLPTSLRLYNKPIEGSKEAYKVLFLPKGVKHQEPFYRQFDDKSAFAYYLGVSSKEKRNGFFKVFYKGSYYWVNEKDVPRVTLVETFIHNHIGTDLLISKAKFYDKPNGKQIKLPKSAYEFLKKNGLDYITFKTHEYKWIGDKLWIKIGTDEDPCGAMYHYKGKVEAWVHPYTEKGKPIYSYSFKGC